MAITFTDLLIPLLATGTAWASDSCEDVSLSELERAGIHDDENILQRCLTDFLSSTDAHRIIAGLDALQPSEQRESIAVAYESYSTVVSDLLLVNKQNTRTRMAAEKAAFRGHDWTLLASAITAEISSPQEAKARCRPEYASVAPDDKLICSAYRHLEAYCLDSATTEGEGTCSQDPVCDIIEPES